jgi:hypothetical protein
MPKVRLLAPWTNEKGEPQAAGATIDVSDEQAKDLHNRGQASLIEQEEQAAQAAEGGVYAERATREGTAPLGGAQPQPEQPEQSEQPESPKNK